METLPAWCERDKWWDEMKDLFQGQIHTCWDWWGCHCSHLRLKAEQSCHPGLRLGLKGKAPGQTGLLTSLKSWNLMEFSLLGFRLDWDPWSCFSFQFYPCGMKMSSWCLCLHCSLELDARTQLKDQTAAVAGKLTDGEELCTSMN